MPSLLDSINPMNRVYGGLLGSMAGSAAPTLAPVTASTTPQMAPQPGFFGRLERNLLGAPAFGAPDPLSPLLGSQDQANARRAGLLNIGLSLLANSAPQNGQNAPPTLAALGQAIQAGRQGFQQQRQQALQEKVAGSQIQSRQATQQKLNALAAKYAPQPNETPEQARERLAGYVSEAITVDPELAGKFNAFAPALFQQPKPTAPTRGVTTTLQGTDGKPHAVLVDPTTGKQIADLGIQPAPPKAPKPPTNQQSIAGAYAARMLNDERHIAAAEQQGVALPDQALLFAPESKKGMALYAAMTPAQQELYTLASDWVAAKLRKESGAVINESEWSAEMRRYFRAAGDNPAVAPVKGQLRKVANYGMVRQAGPAYELDPADSVLIDTGKGGKRPTAPTQGGPDLKRAKSDPAYAAWLRSKGVTF